jgi:glycosyltransferase involved in cell wall biosynthesis
MKSNPPDAFSGRAPDIIVTGTDPSSQRGGIGVVLPGYLEAITMAGFRYACVPTYHPTRAGGKAFLWIMRLPRIASLIRSARRNGVVPLVYSHAGAAPSMLREALVLRLARMMGARTAMQIHAPQLDIYLRSKLRSRFLKVLFAPIGTLCVLTDWWQRRLLGAGLHRHVVVIPNPLPAELHDIAKQASQRTLPETGKIVMLSMARLVDGKGVDVAIQALTQLPSRVHLVVAGEGPTRGSLEQLAQTLGVSARVTFRGWVAGAEKRALLESAHVFCLPSTNDAFPISMVEAMSHGVPVVAVRWQGIPDMVAHGKAGLLTDRPDPMQVALAIRTLIEDASAYSAMTRTAKLWVLEACSPQAVASRLQALFSSPAEVHSHG